MSNSNNNECFLMRNVIKMPCASRLYFTALIAFQLVDIYYQKWSTNHLSNNFSTTILQYQFWRIFINFVYQPSQIVCGLIILHLISFIFTFERKNGSIITLYELITIGYTIQIMIIVIEAIIYLLNDNGYIDKWSIAYNVGAAGVCVNIYFKYLYFNFKQQGAKCSLKCIFTFLYPIFMIWMFSIISNQIRVDTIGGYLLAFIQCLLFKGGIIFYTPDTYTQKQSAIFYLKLNKIPCFNWQNINHNRIQPNNLLVVEARQFYILQSDRFSKENIQFTEQQMETQRGSFNSRSFDQDGRGQKWEKQQIIDDNLQ